MFVRRTLPVRRKPRPGRIEAGATLPHAASSRLCGCPRSPTHCFTRSGVAVESIRRPVRPASAPPPEPTQSAVSCCAWPRKMALTFQSQVVQAIAVGLFLLAGTAATSTEPRVDGVCQSSLDCSLNGDCVDGTCRCDPAWSTSPTCNQIAFDVARTTKDGVRGVYNATQSTWGG